MNKNLLGKFKEAIELINKSDNIFIASHINPDGDNIGSILALGLSLKKLSKNVRILKTDTIPTYLEFLPGIELIEEYQEDMGPDDLFILLDSSDEDRLGKLKRLLGLTSNIINIDHHISNTNFGKINIVDPKACATGEILYSLLDHMNIELDKDIGTNLYTAISTDSGSFKYESVTRDTHEIISKLFDLDIDHSDININLYEKMTINRFKLTNSLLSNANFYNNGRIAIVKVNDDILKETNATMEDTDSIVSSLRKIDTVEVSCLLKEFEKEEIKVSLRSKEYVDVAGVCQEFGGGGHKRAAGCKIEKPIDEVESLLVEEIIKHMGESDERDN